MLAIDLSLGQKLQIGFVAVMFSIAGFLAWRGTRPAVDMTVFSNVKPKMLGIDPNKPIGPQNPVDPSRTLSITYFFCHDGVLAFTESIDPTINPSFSFTADRMRASYDLYKNPGDRLNAIKDPYRRTLSLAAYTAAHGKAMGLLGKVGLTADEIKAEKELRQKMMEKVTDIEEGGKTGHFQPEVYDNVIRSLNAYKAKDGDPLKDPAKSALAHKVIDQALAYIDRMQKEESQAVEAYIDGVDKLLTSDQKTKLAEVGKNVKFPTGNAPPKQPKAAKAGG